MRGGKGNFFVLEWTKAPKSGIYICERKYGYNLWTLKFNAKGHIMIQVLFIAGVVISYLQEEVFIPEEEKQKKSDKRREKWRESMRATLTESTKGSK